MGVVVVLVTAGRAGLRPLALLPVVIVLVVGVLLVWAQSSSTVPKTPTGGGPVTQEAPSGG